MSVLINFMAIRKIRGQAQSEIEAKGNDSFEIGGRQANNFIWQESPLLWAIDNRLKNEKGIELEFRNHRFLKDIYDDWTRVQVVRKASQVGFTTLKILKSLAAAKYRHWNIIYTLPTFAAVQETIPAKVNALISNNGILSSWIKDKDSIYQKQVGKGFVYYRGTFSSKTEEKKLETGVGITLSSDVNIHDECDRSDQAVLEQYESRLEASDYGGKWYFSNPTHPHTLSQRLYEISDQKHWFVKCEACNEWQYLDFWKSIKNYQYVCQKCGKELSDEARRNGQWVKKYENREISGYWISHLICPWISAKKIQEEYETKSRQYFYNFVLGLPYIGSDTVINRDIILKNIDISEPNWGRNNVLGADSGLKKHWVLGNKQGIFKIGVADSWEEIEKLMKVYDVETAVLDALPDLTEPRKLRDKYPGKVWLNYYKPEIKKADFIKWDYKTRTVYSDRTKIIQQVMDDMVSRSIKFQMRPEEMTDYIRHWESVYKITEKDKLGIERDVWETSGEDHFVHATNYFRLAMEKGQKEGTEIKSWEKQEKSYTGLSPDVQKLAEKSGRHYEI